MRVPDFSPPPPALRSFATERKHQERAGENEQQRTQRLTDDRLRTVSAREHEDELQRNIRLDYKRQYTNKS